MAMQLHLCLDTDLPKYMTTEKTVSKTELEVLVNTVKTFREYIKAGKIMVEKMKNKMQKEHH